MKRNKTAIPAAVSSFVISRFMALKWDKAVIALCILFVITMLWYLLWCLEKYNSIDINSTLYGTGGGKGVKERFLIITVLIFFLVQPVAGYTAIAEDTGGIIMKARMGFDGQFKLGHWTPVTIDIENTGEDIQGVLEVEIQQPNRLTSIVYSTPVVIPQDTRKQFNLYVQVNTLQKDFTVRLVRQGTEISSTEIKGMVSVTGDKYMLGLITDDREALNYWKASLGSNRIFFDYQAVHLDIENFPDKKEILDNFSILILNNADTGSFTQHQAEALKRWLFDGGIMIVGTGANGQKTLAGLQDRILSTTSSGIVRLEKIDVLETVGEEPISGDAPFEIMDLTVDNGDAVLQYKNRGIVWKLPRGAGCIFVSAFDLGLEPIVSWTGNRMLWENILNSHLSAEKINILKNSGMSQYKDAGIGISQTNRLREALGLGIKEMDLPSFSKLLLILGAYLLAVGPINYIILKRFDRREWAWFTIPLIVLIFSGIIYGLGYTAKGSEIITNTISLIRLEQDDDTASVESCIGIFVPKKGNYQVGIDDDLLLAPGNEDIYYDYSNPSPASNQKEQKRPVEARVVQGKSPSITFYNTSIWTMRDFEVDSIVDGFGRLDADLYFEGNRIKGSITNNTLYPLEDVVVYTCYGYHVLGNFAAGEKKQVDVPVFARVGQGQLPGLRFYQLVDEVFPYPDGRSGGHMDADEQREKYIRRQIIQRLIMSYPGAPYLIAKRVYSLSPIQSSLSLIGFNTQRIVKNIRVNGEVPEATFHRNVVTAQFIVPHTRDGEVYIPPGVIMAALAGEKSQGIVYNEGNTVTVMGQGTAVFRFDMKPYSDLDFSWLKIYLNYDDLKPELSIYDPQKNDYVDTGEGISVDNKQCIVTIEKRVLERYMTSQGELELAVRFSVNSTLSGRPEGHGLLQLPTLSVEGRAR